MEEVTKIIKEEFKLPNKKVKVSGIRRKGAWLDEKHAANFLFKDSSVRYCVPLKKDRNEVVDILTPEEKEFLSKELRADLSIHLKPKENYWMNRYVKLKDEVKVLDLSNAQDYIDWKILLSNKDDVAPSAMDKYKKGTYRFCISDLDFEENAKAKHLSKNVEAYKQTGKLLVGGRETMTDFLSAYYFGKPGKQVPLNATVTWLETEIAKVVESDLDGFLAITTDKDYDIKRTIVKAVTARALVRDVNRYSLSDGGLIATNLDDLLVWFKNPINSEEVVKIEAKIQQ